MKIFVTEIFFMKIVFFVTEKKIFSVVWSFVHVIVKKLLKYIVSFVTEERNVNTFKNFSIFICHTIYELCNKFSFNFYFHESCRTK